jgi:4-methylaminobutanoate oxidase (formaldehyde-forming)
MELYSRIHAEVGNISGWNQVGSLRLASSPEQMKELQRKVSQAKAIGLNVEFISAKAALDIYPYMTNDSLFGAVYLPQDGYLDPYSMTTEIARRARQMGVTILTGVLANGIDTSPDGKVTRVVTDQGVINTEYVVIASGMWSPRVGDFVGLKLPMNPVRHQYLTTEPIPELNLPKKTPVVRDPDRLAYIREEVGGVMIGGFELNPKAVPLKEVTWEFGQNPFPSDWDRFESVMEGALTRMPVLEKATVSRLLCYADAMTPDGNPCLGPVPGYQGLFVAAGMSLNGFGGGGGMGKMVAEWITYGEPTLDMHEFNIRRFGPIYEDRSFLEARTREAYKYYYHLRFPYDENEWGRPRRVSPLFERTKELGGVFGEKSGWERVNYFSPDRQWRQAGADQRLWGWGRPVFFDQAGLEHQAVRQGVAIADLSSFGKIDLLGPGVVPFLQHLTDNDIDKPVGTVIYTQFLNQKGGIESDLTITRLAEDHFRAITGSAFIYNDLGWMKIHAPAEKTIEIRDVSENWACIGLWGPRSREVFQAVTSNDVGNEAFPYMTAQVGEFTALAKRVSYTGELGWEIYVDPTHAVDLWEMLLKAGKEAGIQPVGYKAIDSLRLEKGYRYWSVDITPNENPYEAGLGFCVRLDKGDFIGREALIKTREAGIRRKLCTLTVEADPWMLYGGEAVSINGHLVSRIRSAGYGHTVGKLIAMAYLPNELAKEGTQVEIEAFGNCITGTVVPDTVYDPKGSRLRV